MEKPNNPSTSESPMSGQEMFTCSMPALPADSDDPIISGGCLTKANSTVPGVELEVMVVAAEIPLTSLPVAPLTVEPSKHSTQ